MLPPQDANRVWLGPEGAAWADRNLAAGTGPARDAVLRAAGAHATGSVLEVGSSFGRWRPVFADGYLGLDLSRDALVRGRDLFPRTPFVVGSMTSLPFPNASFDLVFTSGTLMYARPEALHTVAAELLRVAREGVVLLEYDGPERWHLPQRHRVRCHHHAYPEAFESNGARLVLRETVPTNDPAHPLVLYRFSPRAAPAAEP